jgi:hypothetical protein
MVCVEPGTSETSRYNTNHKGLLSVKTPLNKFGCVNYSGKARQSKPQENHKEDLYYVAGALTRYSGEALFTVVTFI